MKQDDTKSMGRKVSRKRRESLYLKRVTIAVLGDGEVGKTSLITDFTEGKFTEKYEPTIANFYTKHLLHKEKTYQVDIIDTCGTENFPAMRRVDIEKSDAAILVYSPEKEMSFEKISRYRDEITEQKNIPIVVVENKSDLEDNPIHFGDGLVANARDVTMTEWRCQWISTSAKLGLSTCEPFLLILDEIQRRKEQIKSASPKIRRKSSWINKSFSGALSLKRTKSCGQVPVLK